ncbi:chemotaxis protein methyltransferase CheR [Chitinophaga jiangningensis]|uniref:Chemotaxis protein methyltransferase CheR n=1 Tax=Chitinophaga jiangningensis TaxID=1419482 RepID=A0A1M7BQ95_9BACT|nr:protein-glutamate O-methyltransferase CheR [Chitinophaga jiangningensis]SHL57151.1 chemotaxis protein methyltransferase CheR [Chitinophaga jiangningensis]
MVEEISNTELQELIYIIQHQYGYDFNDYAKASLKRRFVRFMGHASVDTLVELKTRLQTEPAFFKRMVEYITVNVTEMFRDPGFYKLLREEVLPRLATYPIIKIWHAGCATGEEVYSMAILLQEAGLLERSRLYATDMNAANLEKANTGIVPMKWMKDYTHNYIQSGGRHDFSDYYTARYDNAIIHPSLRKNIIFFQHNLVTDQVFNEFQLICCRNVFIYFNRPLQEKVVSLFYDSLATRGYLALGMKESMLFSKERKKFEVVNGPYKIFRRKL